MQIHLHEVKILKIHNARLEFVRKKKIKKKNIKAINQSESSILILGVINMKYITIKHFLFLTKIIRRLYSETLQKR